MKAKISGLRRLTAGISSGLFSLGLAAQAFAADKMGQPTDGGIDFQPAASEIKSDVIWFHNWLLLPIITVITLFVLALLLWCIFRYNKRANPVPARFSHNTTVEVTWTVVPVLILTVIAIFSFRLLFKEHAMPTPDLTVKATGSQWLWSYEYPDQKIAEYTSRGLEEDVALKQGLPYRLAADNPMVVPVNKTVRVLVTGADVIHAFTVPAFGIKIDAIPGKVNQTWFKANQTGTFYGQCSELCGIDHAFMPIEVKVVSQSEFDAWVASKAPKPATTTASAPTAPASAPAAAAPAAPAR
jgi:cytochrome c oxidase subunit 2